MNKHEPMPREASEPVGLSDIGAEAFDEALIWSRPGLERHDRHIVAVTASIMQRGERAIEQALRKALNEGVAPNVLAETCVHTLLYVGSVAAQMAFDILKGLCKARDITLETTPLPTTITPDHKRAGAAIKSTLHAERKDDGHANPDATYAPALYSIATDAGYGHIWTRDGLDTRARLICAIAAFTVQPDAEPSFCKFAQAGSDNGLSVREIQEVVIQTTPYVGFPRALKALTLMNDLF